MDLSVLRTARLAQTEDLITANDYDTIKRAFLKAQQIKAGMDAGFLREADFVQARDSFLHALDFKVARRSAAGAAGSGAAAPLLAPAPARAAAAAPAPALPQSRLGAIAAPVPAASRLMAGGSHPSSPTQLKHAAVRELSGSGSGASSSAPRPARPSPIKEVPQQMSYSSGGGPPELDDLPRIGRVGTTDGKKSMSGISVNDQCVNVFNHIKTKSSFKWVTYKIDDAGHEVVVESVGPADSSYAAFVAALAPAGTGQCKYGVFDYAYDTAADAQHAGNKLVNKLVVNKLVFVNWAPENANIRTKMMYASTKDFFKNFLDGVGAELQATEEHELEEEEMQERVHQALFRK